MEKKTTIKNTPSTASKIKSSLKDSACKTGDNFDKKTQPARASVRSGAEKLKNSAKTESSKTKTTARSKY